MTNRIGLDLSTVVADSLQQLLGLRQKAYKRLAPGSRRIVSVREASHTYVKDGCRELNMTEMSRTFLLAFLAGLAIVLTINRAQAGIVGSFRPWPLSLLILFFATVLEVTRLAPPGVEDEH